MASSIKKRGQKIVRKFSRVSSKAREESKEHIKERLGRSPDRADALALTFAAPVRQPAAPAR